MLDQGQRQILVHLVEQEQRRLKRLKPGATLRRVSLQILEEIKTELIQLEQPLLYGEPT